MSTFVLLTLLNFHSGSMVVGNMAMKVQDSFEEVLTAQKLSLSYRIILNEFEKQPLTFRIHWGTGEYSDNAYSIE